MPLAFSFFTAKRPTEPPQVSLDVELLPPVQEVGVEVDTSNSLLHSKSPFPVRAANHQSEPLLQKVASLADGEPSVALAPPSSESSESTPYVALPEKRGNLKGLAALVVNQSTQEAPPLNRQRPPTFPISSLAGQNTSIQEALLDSQAGDHFSLQGADILRCELHQEIEQVKNDLFGAVMGVSALKDRLDGLESQLSQIQSAPVAAPALAVSHAEVTKWMSVWLEENLPKALERAIAAAQEKTLGTMSTNAYFHTTTRLSDTDRQSFLNHPPVILTSTPV